MSDVWYYADQNGQVGPLSLRELKATLATVNNPDRVLVWCNRFPGWKPVEDVPELSENIETNPLPSLIVPTATTLQKKAHLGCLLLLSPYIVIGLMFFVRSQSLTPEEKAAFDRKHEEENTSFEACLFGQKIVKAHLKAPATAEFPSCYGSGINAYSIQANPAWDTFTVEGYVDAQNGFGAKIRTGFEATMSRTGPSDNATWKEVKFSFK
jgi:hypothetical protein